MTHICGTQPFVRLFPAHGGRRAVCRCRIRWLWTHLSHRSLGIGPGGNLGRDSIAAEAGPRGSQVHPTPYGSPPQRALVGVPSNAKAFSVQPGPCFRFVRSGVGCAAHSREPVVARGTFVDAKGSCGCRTPAKASRGPGHRRGRRGGLTSTERVTIPPKVLASWRGPVRPVRARVGRRDDAEGVRGEARPCIRSFGSSKTNPRLARNCG